MKHSLVVGAAAVALCAAPSLVMAHHSGAPFDFMRLVTVEGTVKAFEVMNPHTHATLVMTGGGKGQREVQFEGHSASNFYRAGYRRGSIQPGDRIKIVVAPLRDGREGGFITQFQDAHGLVVGFGNLTVTGSSAARP